MLRPRILIVDDEEMQTRSFAKHFGDEFEIVELNDPRLVLSAVDQSVCVAVVDERMGAVSGITVLSELRNKYPDLVRILITGYGDEYLASAINQARIFHYVEKPFDSVKLRIILHEAVREYRLRQKGLNQLRQYEEERYKLTTHPEGRSAVREALGFSTVVGKSQAITELVKRVRKAVNQPISILIDGETGTGKGALARAIHNESTRSQFHQVNCGLLTNENLARTELFGVVKGAFTDAAPRSGLCEVADKGTLFLDEIAELPLAVQPMLLTFLDLGEFSRVGSNAVIKTDVRLIAATNKNLKDEVAAKRFREDLYFRLKSFEIRLPPLRERVEDIPLLAEYFLKIANAKFGRSLALATETADILCKYAFRGNVRELQSTIETAAIECDGPAIEPRHLPAEIVMFVPTTNNLSARRDELERDQIRLALANTNTQEEAAEKLGISSRWLRKRVKDLGI